MRAHHSNANGTANSVHHLGRPVYANNDDLGSIGTRSGHKANIGLIHQYQASHIGGASKHEEAVLRHANSVHDAANARDPVVMNILKRTQTQRAVHPAEQKFLANRLQYNEKLLARLEAHKHPSNVGYELDVEQNGNSHVEKLRNGAKVGPVLVSRQTAEVFFRR
jgi:hypothetical protein